MSNKSPERLAGDALLQERGQVDASLLIERIADCVPYGKAVRRTHAVRASCARWRGSNYDPASPGVGSEDEVRQGQRNRAVRVIDTAIRSGAWVRDGDLISLNQPTEGTAA